MSDMYGRRRTGLAPREFLAGLFTAAIEATDPLRCVPPALPDPPRGRTVVIGAGKAAARMAQAVEQHWRGDPAKLSGVLVTRYGHGAPCTHLEILQASHPVPDQAGEDAARRILAAVRGLGADDLVLCLISGGGSALMPLPLPGVTLADKQAISQSLLKSGAPIQEMNCVRKHLSALKGGRLAAACAPAQIVTLIISDVPGDDPAVVASGPTLPDPTSCNEALAILDRYAIQLPPAVAAGLRSAAFESPKPDDPCFARQRAIVVASNQMALQAAAAQARAAGITPVVLGDSMEGEAREIARAHAAIARQIASHGQPAASPCVLLSGGETTVTVRGKGRGGRNAEFALAFARSLGVAASGDCRIWSLAADTDGIDGSEDNAGAFTTPETLARARKLGLNPGAHLENNDAYGFFAALDDLLVTGPTRTNVNDFRAILID